jgi:1,2-phenylacetyl-CoA epoxidase PaaB subunit
MTYKSSQREFTNWHIVRWETNCVAHRLARNIQYADEMQALMEEVQEQFMNCDILHTIGIIKDADSLLVLLL